MTDLSALQAERNSGMYAFSDVPRENAVLSCLPLEFWDSLDECLLADAARKKLESELQTIKKRSNSEIPAH